MAQQRTKGKESKHVTVKSLSAKGYSGVDIAVAWHLKDKDLVLDQFAHCKRHPREAMEFYSELVRVLHGKSSLDVQHIGFCFNTMTQDGIQRHAELITMRTNKLFTHFAIGEGFGPTTSQTDKLDDEIGRVNMDTDHGFRVSAGQNIIEAGYFDETYPSFTACESGVFDGDGSGMDPEPEIMEWRAVYPLSQRVPHQQNVNFMTYIHTIFQRAI
jgi:hypothetical protein